MFHHINIDRKRLFKAGIIFFACISISTSIFSQREITYDLDSYKQVVYKRSELLMSSNGGVDADDQVNVAGANLDILLNIDADINHSKFVNSENEQYELRQRFCFQKINSFRMIGQRETTKRKYTGNKFYKYGTGIYSGYFRENNSDTNITEARSNSEIKGDFGIGTGRIEYINHAWSAVQILQALENKNLLLRIPSPDEITDLANEIGRVRTSRILDFRLRDIAILEHLISFFVENELIDSLSTMAILIIEDTFQYDEIIPRQAGDRLEYTLTPKVNFLTRPEANFQFNRFLYTGVTGEVLKEKYKNVDIKWMKYNSFGLSLESEKQYFYSSNNQFDPLNMSRVIAKMTHNYGYFFVPNLRNNLRLNVESSISLLAIPSL